MRANCYEVFVSALLEWSAFPALILSAGTLRFSSLLESGSGVWPGLHAGEWGHGRTFVANCFLMPFWL